MLFSYLCATGAKLHREAYPQGAQSKDADVFKWVALHSGSPAVCQRQHDGAHLWRPDDSGEEERVVRGYAALQWDRQGLDLSAPMPAVGDAFDSPWGPSIVVEKDDDPIAGAFLLLRILAHGYHGKPGETGTRRTDVPAGLAGRV